MRSKYGGGLLADPVGLGKSLTALVAALRYKVLRPDSGPVLVTCRKGSVMQWYEEACSHFEPVCVDVFVFLSQEERRLIYVLGPPTCRHCPRDGRLEPRRPTTIRHCDMQPQLPSFAISREGDF